MSATQTIKVDIDRDIIVDAVARTLDPLWGNLVAVRPQAFAPIGAECHGGIYAGTTVHENGAYALILLPGDVDLNWQAAVDWAKHQGGELPSRIDQLVLLQNLKKEFKEAAYWSGTQYAGDAGSAWFQYFDVGSQGYGPKYNELRARAVRRIAL